VLNLPLLLTPAETAKLLRISVGTLAVWRCTHRVDLKFIKVGRAVRYRESDVKDFIAANERAA
jgi:excisionase family DNA binding protein